MPSEVSMEPEVSMEDEAQEIIDILNHPDQLDPWDEDYDGLLGEFAWRTEAIGKSLMEKGATPQTMASFIRKYVPDHAHPDIDIVWTLRIPEWANSNIDIFIG